MSATVEQVTAGRTAVRKRIPFEQPRVERLGKVEDLVGSGCGENDVCNGEVGGYGAKYSFG